MTLCFSVRSRSRLRSTPFLCSRGPFVSAQCSMFTRLMPPPVLGCPCQEWTRRRCAPLALPRIGCALDKALPNTRVEPNAAHFLAVDDDATEKSLRNAVYLSPIGSGSFARHIQHLVAVDLVPQSGDDGVIEAVPSHATVYQHFYGAVASVVPRPCGWIDRESPPVLQAGVPQKISGVVFEATRA